MNRPAGLVPPSVEGRARTFTRAGVAFGPRFFLLLLIGLAWLIPAFEDARFVWAMLAWDAVIVVLWGVDLARLPRPEQLSVRRTWSAPPALSVASSISLMLTNESTTPVRARVLDTVPLALSEMPPELGIDVAPRSDMSATYTIHPGVRGETTIGGVYLRYRSILEIAERWAMVDLAQVVVTAPNLDDAKKQTLALIRSRQIDREKRVARMRGAGRVFESLREYREGDELRDVCWTASARRGKLTMRVFEIERSQTVWVLIDAGRLMRTRVAGLSKLDYAVNAALALAQVALNSGDRVGVLCYNRRAMHRLPAARGATHLRQIIDELAGVREDEWEADHRQAAGRLLRDQRRRCLVVWVTDLADTAATPDVVRAALQVASRHVVLLAVIGQPDLHVGANRTPKDVAEMYDTVAAQEVAHRRERLLASLREGGALAFETSSAKLTAALVNSYLDIKQQGRL